MVHHDDVLGRLTDGEGRLDAMPAAELKRVAFKATDDRMLTLGELCALVAGRATLVIELKSRFDGDVRLPRRAAQVLEDYKGPVAVMSFDPGQIAAMRDFAPDLLRGLVAMAAGPHARAQFHDRSRSAFVLQALVGAAAVPGLSGAGPALAGAELRAQCAGPAAADLDGAHAGGPARAPRSTPTRSFSRACGPE